MIDSTPADALSPTAAQALAVEVRGRVGEALWHPLWLLTGGDTELFAACLAACETTDAVPTLAEVRADAGVQAAARTLLDRRVGASSLPEVARQAVPFTFDAADAPAGSPAQLPLLRDALLASLDPPEARRLHAEAGRRAFAERRSLAALQHAAAAGDPALAAECARRDWADVRSAHAAAARAALEQFGEAGRREHPMLVLLYALVVNVAGSRSDTGAAFARVVETAQRMPPATPAAVQTLVFMSASAHSRRAGDGAAAGQFAREALAVLDAHGVATARELGRALPTLYAQLGQSLHVAGEIAAALDCLARAASCGPSVDEGTLAGVVLYGALLAERGEIQRADAVLQRARGCAPTPSWWDGFPASGFHVGEAWIAIERGDAAGAHAHLDRLTPNLALIEQRGAVIRARAMAYVAASDLPAALTLLRTAPLAASAFHGVPRLEYDLTRAFVELAAGEAEVAEALLQAAPGGVAATMRALAALVGDRAADALALLPDRVAHDPLESPRIACHRLVVRAAALLRLGLPREGAEFARAGAALMRELGLTSPLWMLPRRDREALATVLGEPVTGGPELYQGAPARPLLTEREAVVLRQLAASRSVPQIARDLHVSANTVKSQLRSVYRKLAVRTRDEALARAAQLGL